MGDVTPRSNLLEKIAGVEIPVRMSERHVGAVLGFREDDKFE
jgi:hypothetical protein